MVALVIVSYNTREVLKRCIASTGNAGASEIIVVDNCSTDGSAEMVSRDFPEVTLYALRENLGYGAAANFGIARSSAEFIFLLNSDTLLPAGAAGDMGLYLADHPTVGMAGPRLRNSDGTLQPSCHRFPTPAHTLIDYSWLRKICGQVPIVRGWSGQNIDHGGAHPVDWVTGAALMIRRQAFEQVQGFDPAYFMYFEEVDLSFRLLKAGWETHFAPVTDVIHLGGVSTEPTKVKMYAVQILSGVKFYENHFSRRAARLGAIAFQSTIWLNWMSDAFRYLVSTNRAARQDRHRRMGQWRAIWKELRNSPNLVKQP